MQGPLSRRREQSPAQQERVEHLKHSWQSVCIFGRRARRGLTNRRESHSVITDAVGLAWGATGRSSNMSRVRSAGAVEQAVSSSSPSAAVLGMPFVSSNVGLAPDSSTCSHSRTFVDFPNRAAHLAQKICGAGETVRLKLAHSSTSIDSGEIRGWHIPSPKLQTRRSTTEVVLLVLFVAYLVLSFPSYTHKHPIPTTSASANEPAGSGTTLTWLLNQCTKLRVGFDWPAAFWVGNRTLSRPAIAPTPTALAGRTNFLLSSAYG